MKAFLYYLSLPLFTFLSFLPFAVLYKISNFFFFILYSVINYRRKVILQNLKNAYPEKSDEAIEALCKEYYKHLCDLVVETIKTLSISSQELTARCRLLDIPFFDKLHAQNKNLIVVMGHSGNWEWAGPAFSLQTKYLLLGIYKPLSNPHFEKLLTSIRTRFNTKITPMNNTLRGMITHKNTLNVTAFIADQVPSHDNVYWTNFLKQETAFFLGPEKIAKKFNYPVVFISMSKVKRGFYEIHADLLFESLSQIQEGEMMEAFAGKLESEINRQPEIWLWSHRRWKKKRRKQSI